MCGRLAEEDSRKKGALMWPWNLEVDFTWKACLVGKLPAPLALSLPILNKAAHIHLLSRLRSQDAQSAL